MNERLKNKIKHGHKSWWLILIILVLTFATGVLTGRVWQLRTEFFKEDGTVEITKVINLYSQNRSQEVNFDQFWAVWDKIKNKYVQQPVDEVELFYGSLEGMVAGLDDPYSVYLPPEPAEEFAKDLAGEFEGIGAEIGLRDNQLVIVAPLPSSPAENAGLKPGDKILAIDGEDTFGITLDAAVNKIRGPKGSEVTLTVTHDGYETAEDVVIARDTINVPTVAWRMIEEDKVAYLRINYFNENTWKEFDKAVRELLLETPAGIVLDLRSNPGGYLETSVSVASEWIDKGVIVSEKFSGGEENKYNTRGKHRLSDIPTVVLVDQGTASGSEIVAGALQDHGLAKLVGIQTFGKGSVQDFEVLPDGSALKLTIAKWYTPNDRVIEEEGIMPDVIVEEMFVEVESEGEEETYKDVGLEKALEILRGETGN